MVNERKLFIFPIYLYCATLCCCCVAVTDNEYCYWQLWKKLNISFYVKWPDLHWQLPMLLCIYIQHYNIGFGLPLCFYTFSYDYADICTLYCTFIIINLPLPETFSTLSRPPKPHTRTSSTFFFSSLFLTTLHVRWSSNIRRSDSWTWLLDKIQTLACP